MSLQKLVTNYAAYNAWVNEQYAQWLSARPEDLLKKEVASSFTSMLKTLYHIHETQEFWYEIIIERYNFREQSYHEDISVNDLLRDLQKGSQKLLSYVSECADTQLSKKIQIKNEWFECNLPRYEYIQHIINHGTYHRGQVVTIGRSVGITDAPMTDYNMYNVVKNGNLLVETP